MNLKNIVALSLLISAISVVVFFAVTKSDKDAESAFVAVKEEFANEEYYTVKKSGEKIGIFDSENEPYLQIETYVFTLPEVDRTMLEEGFKVRNGEIVHVIEDYTG